MWMIRGVRQGVCADVKAMTLQGKGTNRKQMYLTKAVTVAGIHMVEQYMIVALQTSNSEVAIGGGCSSDDPGKRTCVNPLDQKG